MSTKAPSAKPGFLRAVLDPLVSLYDRRLLIKSMAQRQVGGGYKRHYLGFVWAFLNPLITVVALTLVFSEMLGLRYGKEVTGDPSLNFGLFLFCGLVPFRAFSSALNNGVNIVRKNRKLVLGVRFPLEILPMPMVISMLVQNAIGLGMLALILVVVEHRLNLTAILVPLVMVPQMLLFVGLCYLCAVAGTYVPDIKEALRLFVRGMFFITPILWSEGRVPEDYQFLVDLNPLAYLVETYRDLILEGRLPGVMETLYFSLFALGLFVAALAVFNRAKPKFADLL